MLKYSLFVGFYLPDIRRYYSVLSRIRNVQQKETSSHNSDLDIFADREVKQQCQSTVIYSGSQKKSPLRFSEIFSQTVGNF